MGVLLTYSIRGIKSKTAIAEVKLFQGSSRLMKFPPQTCHNTTEQTTETVMCELLTQQFNLSSAFSNILHRFYLDVTEKLSLESERNKPRKNKRIKVSESTYPRMMLHNVLYDVSERLPHVIRLQEMSFMWHPCKASY